MPTLLELRLLAFSYNEKQILLYYSSLFFFVCSLAPSINSSQVERLKLENTSEWGKRERLEGEKQNLEEESITLKLQVKEIQRLLEMRNKATPIKLSCDHQNTQSKLLVKNKVCAFLSLIT